MNLGNLVAPAVTGGKQLEGTGLSKSAGGWHLQHHLKHRVLGTSSESPGRGFPTSRGKDAHPHVLWRHQLWGTSLTLCKASGNPVEGLWPSRPGAVSDGKVLVSPSSECANVHCGNW